MQFYFVSTGRKSKVELETIKELKPPRIMASYHYFKNIDLGEFIKELGYKPKIILDSGAYSAFTSGKEIDIEKYIAYIKKNEQHIFRYICLDKLGDNEKSFEVYLQMKNRGLNPIPVFHYMGDEKYLDEYIKRNETLVALGGTVPIKSKSEVAEWVRMICWMYPQLKFHLLGSASRKILDHCDIESADASTWIMAAIMGKPKSIPGNDEKSRKERAKFNMLEMMKRYKEPG